MSSISLSRQAASPRRGRARRVGLGEHEAEVAVERDRPPRRSETITPIASSRRHAGMMAGRRGRAAGYARAVAGLTQAEAERRLAERGALRAAGASRSTRSIVAGERRHAVQRRPRRARRADARLRRLARRALPRHRRSRTRGSGSRRSCARSARSTGSPRWSRRGRPSSATARRASVAVEQVVEGDLVRVAAGRPGRRRRARSSRPTGSRSTSRSSPASRGRSRAGHGEEVRSRLVRRSRAPAPTSSTAVGEDSYAERIAGEAREFRHPRSPLERSLNRLLYVLVAISVPLGVDARRRARRAGTAIRASRSTIGCRRARHARPGGADPALLA